MSSCPGHTLEDYLAWNYSIVFADSTNEPNFSLAVAELIGTIRPRQCLNPEQAKALVAIFESTREDVEQKLEDYDEDDHGSFRDYCCIFDCFITDKQYLEGQEYLLSLTKA